MDKKKHSKKGNIRAENNQKILIAAEIEFVKHGYKGTSIQSISDAAGLPKANLLYYFSSKSKLYNALLKNIVLRWNEQFTDITEEDDPTATLELYIRTKVEQAILYPNASKIFATEIIQGAPNLNKYLCTDLRDWLKANCKIIDSWIAQGKMSKVDPEQLFFLIWSSTQHYADFEAQILTITDKRKYQTEDIERISRFLCHMILSGCGLTPSQAL
ncbi:MAG: TetR/AcrR family transcriptional regulator [Colwellia sp.]